jgi:hypothetical protein
MKTIITFYFTLSLTFNSMSQNTLRFNYKPSELDFNKTMVTYTGDIVNGKANGKGTAIYDKSKDWIETANSDSEDYYTGEWKDNKLDGFGIHFNSFVTVIGEFKEGKRHGKVKSISHYDVYEGDYVNDSPSGKVKEYNPQTKDVFEVDFVNGSRDGHGKYILINGITYEGEWKKGNPKGKGIYYLQNGVVEKGKWDLEYIDKLRKQERIYNSNCKVFDIYLNSSYEGDCLNGFANGFGTAKGIYTYIGDFVDGKKEGKGKYTYFDGYYEGDWKNDVRHGIGKLVLLRGDVYEGNWVNGSMTGEGKHIKFEGGVYVGDFVNGVKTGKGKYTSSNGGVYEGDFVNGEKTGKGKYTSSNGVVSEGEWLNGKKVIIKNEIKNEINEHKVIDCKVIDPDISSTYEGGCSNGLANGFGTAKGRATYVGNFANGKKEGKGKYTWEDGSWYEGDWKNDKREGKGKKVWPKYPSDAWYDGDWKDDKMNGYGTLNFGRTILDIEPYESKYVGNILDGSKEGQGTFYYRNGDRWEGEWKNNEQTIGTWYRMPKTTSNSSSNSNNDSQYENAEIPTFKEGKWEKGNSTFWGDYYYSEIEFNDGESGTLYQGCDSKEFFYSNSGTKYYYKTKASANKALYLYKKFNYTLKNDRIH